MTLVDLRQALLDEGGTLAEMVALAGAGPGAENGRGAEDGRGAEPPQLAASGPRAASDPAEYELLLEMILEGSRLHYAEPRVVRCADRNLALLLGDQLYALGLAHLAALGDLKAVAELADVISLVAQAHAAGNPPLADALWRAGAAAIGWGPTPDHEAAKELARAGDPRAQRELSAAWRDVTTPARLAGM